jgi:DNA-binding NarL/FixJ family response regulator
MLRIALVDDHAPTLERFSKFFQQHPDFLVVAQAVNGYDLILQLNKLTQLPDIILVDMNMPIIDGVAVTYYLWHKYHDIKIINVTCYDDEEAVKQCLNSGANGFVLKAAAETVLLNAIEEVSMGNFYIDTRLDLLKETKYILMRRRNKIFENEPKSELTNREKEFIILNATTLSYEQIAQIMFVETKTIQTYFDRVSKKLNINTRQALIIHSLQNGLARIADYVCAA